MTIAYPILSAVIAALIESVRIGLSKGSVTNINKSVTYFIGLSLFLTCLDLSTNYYYELSFIQVVCYLVYFAAVRGVIYDPLLNVLRGLPVDYKSKSTNSVIDILIGNRVNFFLFRFIYLAISIIFGIIWLNLLQNY